MKKDLKKLMTDRNPLGGQQRQVVQPADMYTSPQVDKPESTQNSLPTNPQSGAEYKKNTANPLPGVEDNDIVIRGMEGERPATLVEDGRGYGFIAYDDELPTSGLDHKSTNPQVVKPTSSEIVKTTSTQVVKPTKGAKKGKKADKTTSPQVDKYTTHLKPETIRAIKRQAFETDRKDYQIVQEALEAYFEANGGTPHN